jgi:amino acid transporter
MKPNKKSLTLFSIIMINVIAVDNIRTLPFAAQYGFSLVFFYLIAGIFFLFPIALVAAELGTGWPERGGLYVWIKEAFGMKVASIMIWLTWIENLAWYPTIMALIAGIGAYSFNPALATNKLYIFSVVFFLFWGATIINFYGMKISSWVSTIGAIFGTLVPIILIIGLSFLYLAHGGVSEIKFDLKSFLPSGASVDKLGFFSSVLFGLVGLEMVAAHAKEMLNPKKDYPKALFISAFVILISIIFSALAIAIVVPHNELDLVTGILQAFSVFLAAFNIPFLKYFISLAIILGALSSVSAWIIGPTKGIMVASEDNHLPSFLSKANRHKVPINALITQGIIVSFLSLFYLYMPSVNSAFILLSVITAQLAMIVHITLFAAAIVLHHKKGHIKRAFKIPGGSIGIWIVASMGIGISTLALIAGFIPPKAALITNVFLYETLLVGVMIALSLFPLLFAKISTK